MQENGQSKTSLVIRMLQILSSGRVYKASELASLLNTNQRNINEYKKEIEDVLRYPIITIPGKHGGYKLDTTAMIPSLRLSNDEKKILQIASDYITARGDFLDRDTYIKAMSKVFSSISNLPVLEETFVIPGVTLSMSAEELSKRHSAIESSIERKTKIIIDFLCADNVVRERTVHPYKLFMSNNAWFVIGYCEMAGDIRYFKLNRIEKFTLTDKKYPSRSSYNEHDYFDKTGFKIGKDWHQTENNQQKDHSDYVHIKLELTGPPAMYVKEYIYGKNQTVTAVDTKTTILECDMHYVYNTIKFVLGFGVDCKVLEPEWLKKEVKAIAEKMLQQD